MVRALLGEFVMPDAQTTALLRAILDELCCDIPRHQNECCFATARNRAARQIFDRRSQAGRESRPAPAPNHVALAENTRHGAIFEARLWVSERR